MNPGKYLLTFGKYIDYTLDFVRKKDFRYVRWLAGYKYLGKHCSRDPFETLANKIGIDGTCECSNLPTHERTCYGLVRGATIHETQTNLERLNGEWEFEKADMAWFTTVRLHTEAVYWARKLIDESKLCWHCGKAMPPIGRARAKGKKTHDDWETRTFHKKCYGKLNYQNDD